MSFKIIQLMPSDGFVVVMIDTESIPGKIIAYTRKPDFIALAVFNGKNSDTYVDGQQDIVSVFLTSDSGMEVFEDFGCRGGCCGVIKDSGDARDRVSNFVDGDIRDREIILKTYDEVREIWESGNRA